MWVTATPASPSAPTPSSSSAASRAGTELWLPVSTSTGEVPSTRYPAVTRSQPPRSVSIWVMPGAMTVEGTRSAELDGGELAQFREPVAGVDQPDGARLRPHDERLRGGAVAVVVHAPEQLAVGDAGGREEAVVAGDEVVDREHAVDVVAAGDGGLPLVVVARPQPALHVAAHALEGGGGHHALGRSADAEHDVDVEERPGGSDGAEHVAVGDEPGARAGRPHLGDQVGMAVAIEDD